MASCGKSEVCECVDTSVEAMKEMKALNGDATKMKALEEKYKPKMDKCSKLNEGKSDSDKKKMEEEAKKCDGYAELDKMMKEGMK